MGSPDTKAFVVCWVGGEKNPNLFVKRAINVWCVEFQAELAKRPQIKKCRN